MAFAYQQTIATAAASNGINPSLLNSVIMTESSGNPNTLPSPTGVQGIAQITQATWASNFPGVPYTTDPTAQINAAAAIIGNYNTKYGGNQALIAAAYNGGPAVANAAQNLIAQGVPPVTAISMAAAEVYPNNPAKQSEVNNYITKVTYGASNNANFTGPNIDPDTEGIDDSDPAVATEVSGMPIDSAEIVAVQSEITPPIVITAGLDETPWFSDQNIIQVDGATKGVPTPITFSIYFDVDKAPMPVTVKLNASLTTIDRGLRHVINRQPTRTGYLLTLWGMQPDLITGAGSTGVFMNQLGLTDYMSMSDAPDAIQKQVLAAFKTSDLTNDDILEASMSNEGFFRIAAKDAFVELLNTFKNTGIVWFQNPNYNGYVTNAQPQQPTSPTTSAAGLVTNQTQLGPDAWSPQTGSSTYQNQGRRNDVMTRGAVAMSYRNSTYFGYFKSFTWTEDAEKPFSWNFTFTFQVERTVTCVTVPDLSNG